MSEPNTFIDGCGVFPDTPIGENTRIRFRLAEDRQQDISVRLEDGALHIYGMYRRTIITFDQPNHFSVETEVLDSEEVLGNANAGGASNSSLPLPLRRARAAAIDRGEDQEGLQG